MPLMKREEWQDLLRQVNWTPSYVDDEAIFPEWQSGTGRVPRAAWDGWEESYKITYGEYVAMQHDKEVSAFAVKAALQRSTLFDNIEDGWKSCAKLHFGGVSLAEYTAFLAEARMARFGLSGAWRNMAVLGALDEIRHCQLSLSFAHELVSKDPDYDWAHKALRTNSWAAIAVRTFLDHITCSPNVVDTAIQLPLVFETGFTNLQFVALASDALAAGDVNFANMLSSIQTDEARHAQQGGPTLEILMRHDPERAQWLIDKTFWLSARLFAILTGPAMDYYTPLSHRQQSYKEFMEEWIVTQFSRTLADYGLKKPWYWEEFLDGLDTWHHSLHLGVWFWRPTVWWQPRAAVSAAERKWLSAKYPKWEEIFGPMWDQLLANIDSGNLGATSPETIPWMCNMCHLPQCTYSPSPDGKYRVRDFSLVYDDRTYHFCSDVCREIWRRDRDMLHVKTIAERFLAGEIQPQNIRGLLSYMGITSEVTVNGSDESTWLPLESSHKPDEAVRASTDAIVPVNAKFGDDFVMHVVLLAAHDTMVEVARKVARHSVGKRIAHQDRDMTVYYQGRAVAAETTVTQAGIAAHGHVFVDYAPAPAAAAAS
jgi:toluene monooxygenase system protein A